MEISYANPGIEGYGTQTRKPVELVVPPVTLLETDRFKDERPKPQIMFEEQIRDLFNEDLEPGQISAAMAAICELGEKYWQSVEEIKENGFPEIDGRLVADIRADYERARLTLEGSGNFPRQLGRVMTEIVKRAPVLIENNHHNLVNRRLMINYRNGQISQIKFRNKELKQRFIENQEKLKQSKLDRVKKLIPMLTEQFPEVKNHLEVTKEQSLHLT